MMKFLHPSVARAARAFTRLGQQQLAEEADVLTSTVHRLERGSVIDVEHLEKILAVFERHGVHIKFNANGQYDRIRLDVREPGGIERQ